MGSYNRGETIHGGGERGREEGGRRQTAHSMDLSRSQRSLENTTAGRNDEPLTSH